MRDSNKSSSKKEKDSEPKVKKAYVPDPSLFGSVGYLGDAEDFLQDEKRLKRFITSIERLVRRSLECKSFIKYLKEELKMDHCYFLQNIKLSKVISLELHHTPFTLYDIVKIVVNKMILTNEKPFSTFMIAKKVTELHYRGIIGLVPVSKTIHQLIHAGKVVVPPHIIFGNVMKFIEEYKDYIDEDYFKKIYGLVTLEDDQIAKINSIIISRPIQYSKDSSKQREELKTFFEEKQKEIIEVEVNKENSKNEEKDK